MHWRRKWQHNPVFLPGESQGRGSLVSCRLWDFPGKSAGVYCHFLLQGIFLTQESNPGLPHCRQTLYCLSHQGSPCSLTRDQTWEPLQGAWSLSHWTTREVPESALTWCSGGFLYTVKFAKPWPRSLDKQREGQRCGWWLKDLNPVLT